MRNEKKPTIHPTAYIAPGAFVRGEVVMMEESSVWHNCTLHGDPQPIVLGKRSSLQELCCVHTGFDDPVIIGDDVNIGHSCIIHGCVIEDQVTVGMGSIIMDGAVIGKGSYIGAGALITGGTKIPPNSLVVGYPAKVIRESSEAQREDTLRSVQFYVEEARREKEKFNTEHR